MASIRCAVRRRGSFLASRRSSAAVATSSRIASPCPIPPSRQSRTALNQPRETSGSLREPPQARAGMTPLMAAFAASLSLAAAPSCAGTQDGRAPGWPEVKCARYKQAWADALARRGRRGLGQEFLGRHEAFLASGSTARDDVCPRSAEELDLANVLVIAAMNAGTASSFLLFA